MTLTGDEFLSFALGEPKVFVEYAKQPVGAARAGSMSSL
jgi:hypothetical protein